jgi:hypothetical protein
MIMGDSSTSYSSTVEDYQLPEAPPPENPPPPPENPPPEDQEESLPEDQEDPPPEEDDPEASAAKNGMAENLVWKDFPPAVFDVQSLKRGTPSA